MKNMKNMKNIITEAREKFNASVTCMALYSIQDSGEGD